MARQDQNGRLYRGLGSALLIVGAVLLGWVGLQLLKRDAAQSEARSELRSQRERVAVAVSRAPAWDPDAVLGTELDIPEEPAASPAKARPRSTEKARTGRLIGRIFAPEVGVDTMAFEGIDLPTLELGAGHFPGTPLPGRPGNVSFAGHRNSDFRGLRDIEVGHSIYVETRESIYLYRVSQTRVVEPEQVEVVAPRGRDELTLVTCHPFDWVGPAPRRFIVHADFVHKEPAGAPNASR